MNTFLKKLLGLSLIIACPLFFHSCAAFSRMMKYNDYKSQIGEQLPDSFRMELPFQVDSNYRFIVRGQVNGQCDMDFIVDTQADNLVKSEDLKRLNATFWMIHAISTYDMYMNKVKDSLYHFDDFRLGSLSFGHILFHDVRPNSYIHGILSETGKSVLGREALHLLNWKFDVDEEKLTLFRQKKGNSLLTQEAEGGYLKIRKGSGRRKKNTITFSGMNLSGKFILDMGADSELAIGDKLFRKLSKKVPYKRIEGGNGSVYLFEDIDVEWNGLVIRHCHANYVKGRFLKNFIGSGLLSRFNFILAYKLDYGYSLAQKDLYLKPRKDFSSIRYTPLISPFGFIAFQGSIAVEAGGLADKAGVRPGDRLVTIDLDHSPFTIMDYRELNRYLRDKKRVEIEVERGKERINFQLSLENIE